MDRVQRGGCEAGRQIALIKFNVIADTKFLAEPQDALRPLIVEMVDDNHLWRSGDDAKHIV